MPMVKQSEGLPLEALTQFNPSSLTSPTAVAFRCQKGFEFVSVIELAVFLFM